MTLLPSSLVIDPSAYYGLLILSLVLFPGKIRVHKYSFYLFTLLSIILLFSVFQDSNKFGYSSFSAPIVLFYTLFPFLIGVKYEMPSGKVYNIGLLLIVSLLLLQQGLDFNVRKTNVQGFGPISMGMVGCLLMFSSLKGRLKYLSIFLGLLLVILSGTRSMLVLALLFLLIKNHRLLILSSLIVFIFVSKLGIDLESMFSIARRLSESADNPRQEIWLRFYQEISSNYFLWPSSTRLMLAQSEGFTYPHNFILEVFALLGLMALPVLVTIAYNSAKNWHRTIIYIPIVFASLFSFSIYTNFYMWFYFGYITKRR